MRRHPASTTPRPRRVRHHRYWLRRVTALSSFGTAIALGTVGASGALSAEAQQVACATSDDPDATPTERLDPQQADECPPASETPTAENPAAQQPAPDAPAPAEPAPQQPAPAPQRPDAAAPPAAGQPQAPASPPAEQGVPAPDTHQDSGSQTEERRTGRRRSGGRARGKGERRRSAGRNRATARRRAAARRERARRLRVERLRAERLRAERLRERREARERRGKAVRPSLRLPDPLPAAERLDAGFARDLVRISRREDVSWTLVLAILRARGHDGASPASRAGVRELAHQLAELGADRHPIRAATTLARSGMSFGEPLPGTDLGSDGHLGERIVALTRYHAAVGMDGLTRGLSAVKSDLIDRVLDDPRLSIYPGGRSDIRAGRIDVRVLVLLRYLGNRWDSVTITSLQSGHSILTKSGNVSRHSVGLAVDIAALNGQSILGNQQPGGVTERALRHMLLLPGELRPVQLISLFEFGGPTISMADHHDHIHAGY